MTTPADDIRLVTSSRIPVRNLWLLQLFASHLYRHGDVDLSGFEDMPEELPDAVAQLLVYETAKRLRQSLTVGFRRRQDQLPRVRGRIDVLDTYRHRYLDRGRVSCRFDEIAVDTPGNRLVRAALARATRLVTDPELAQRARVLHERLRAFGIGDTPPRTSEFSALLANRNTAHDRRMLCAAELLLTFRIPAPGDDGRSVVDIFDGDQFLRTLFEHAVHGFFEHRLSRAGWSVRHGRRLAWDVESSSPGLRGLLPSMITDVELEHTMNRRHIVIDTKFTSIRRIHHGQDRFKSEHIYQIYAYLMSQQDRRATDGLPPSEGLLLHPSVDGHVDEEFTVQGHRVRFYTVDLAARADIVIAQLAGAVSERPRR